jgi:hypothetical protein
LQYNIFAFLFDSDVNAVMPSFPWKLAAQLVHEHEHFLFCKAAGMIGKDEATLEKFFKENWSITEKSAYVKQIAFLTKCREKISSTVVHQFTISGWLSDGTPAHQSVYKPIVCSKQKVLDVLNTVIAECEKKLSDISAGVDYPKEAEKNDEMVNADTLGVLSLSPLKQKEAFPTTILKL